MMYSSKQKLAMAMAATMVVSMAPAMSFAAQADVDAVIAALGKEDVSLAKKGDVSSAEKVVAEAKLLVNGDEQAQAFVDAYQASIDVFKAVSLEDFNAKKVAFDAAVAKIKFNVDGSFKAQQTMDNHNMIKAKFEAPATVTASYTEKKILGVTLVEVTLKGATAADVTKVFVNDKAVDFAKDAENPNMVTANSDVAVVKVQVEVGGKLIEAMK